MKVFSILLIGCIVFCPGWTVESAVELMLMSIVTHLSLTHDMWSNIGLYKADAAATSALDLGRFQPL